MSCGTLMSVVCPACATVAEPGAQFCVECGTGFAAAAPAPAAAPDAAAAEAPGLSEERRKATVLFADLSGYTAISARLDPEDAKALVDQVLGRLSREVVANGGRVDKYIGDSVMAVFGAPIAHEDDPERAVRSGLAMQAAMSEINAAVGARPTTRGVEFELRVGINTGEVLAGRSGEQYTVIGDTVNVASRLESNGAPGAVTVGSSTHRLTATSIEYRELEPMTVKGKAEPITAWEAVRVIDEDLRPRAAGFGAPLIGRSEELALLVSLFDRAVRESRPHLVTVFGQAGVGKSRLLDELASALSERDPPVQTLIGRSPAYGTATTYSALGDIVRGRFGIPAGEDPAAVTAKLTEGISGLKSVGDEAEAARVATQIARVMGIDNRDDGAEELDPEAIRDRIFAAVRLLLELVAGDSPAVVAIEDIHWANDGTLDLIEHLARWAQGPVLIVCLARDELLEQRPGWGGGRRNATTISLDSLSGEEATELVRTLLSGREADGLLAEQVAERSGGNPLFAEEMVNRLREEGTDDVGELPDSVHAVLAARLDALGIAERRVLQSSAVVGQSFSEETVIELMGGEPLEDEFGRLVEKDLISPAGKGSSGGREFAFKHALVRDVAYAMLPRAVRAERHGEVAGIIESRAGANRDGVAALLAEHYGRAAELGELAGLPEEQLRQIRVRAARASASAGDVAASLYSNAEALSHYEHALGLPQGLDAAERARVHESRGDTAFRSGHVDLAIESWTLALEAREASEDLMRVGDLHRKIGSGHWQQGDRKASIANFQLGIDLLKDLDPSPELVELYEEAAAVYLETGDNMLAVYAAEKAQRLSEALDQSSTASRANLTFGRVFGRIGDFDRARQSLERSVELGREASPGEAIRALSALGRHLEVAEADYAAAEAACEEALSLADRLGDVPAQIEIHAALGQLAVHPARWTEVERHAAASAQLAEREGLFGQRCLPLLLQGIHAWHLGDWEEAADRLRRAHEIAVAGGRLESATEALLWLAACDRDRGEHAEASATLTTAVELCERAGFVAQLAEVESARAVALAQAGRIGEGRAAAERVEELLSGRAAHPVGLAASSEARGATAEDADAALDALRAAVDGWERAGRPLDAIGARLLLAGELAKREPEASIAVLEEAIAEAERVDVPHLAAAARSRRPTP